MSQHCDVAIVGAGAAGAILAARLSEDPSCRVALIEAGKDTPPGAVPADIDDIFPRAYSNAEYFWPQLMAGWQAGQPRQPFPQARVMGGGSAVMGMWALRGRPSDYDAWRDAGAVGWGWSDVLPFFKRLETDRDFPDDLHGTSGPIVVHRTPPAQWPDFVKALAGVAEQAGLPLLEDINGDFRDGVFPVPVTNDGARRTSSASGYLTPEVRRRPNLVILSQTEVQRLVFSGRAVTGLELTSADGSRVLGCRQAVLSAGAIGSPALLLRSGIGPAAALAALGIQPVVDLPGVGGNLQNHCIVNFAARLIPSARQSRSLRTYGLACGRLSSGHPQGQPGDLHLQFIARTSLNPHGDAIGLVGASLYAPRSRGKVSLASPDPGVAPQVDFCLLSDDADQQRLAIVSAFAMRLLADKAVRPLRDEVFTVLPSSMVRRLNRPGALNVALSGLLSAGLRGPRPLRRVIARQAGRLFSEPELKRARGGEATGAMSPIFHPAGTCAIGADSDQLAVLDPMCRVRGVAGLRVVDASVMPVIPSGNTGLPTMMVAERAAALLAGRRGQD